MRSDSARDVCGCGAATHDARLIVITGGPGAGKTAVLETASRAFCRHVAIMPEAASIVYGGGFPRRGSLPGKRAAQRAIYHVQRELERVVVEEHEAALALCDRATLDGLAYWPDTPEAWYADLGSTPAAEMARYSLVIHLRTPPPGSYNHRNPLRIESASEAEAIDERILAAWRSHPRVVVVDSSQKFVNKVTRVLELLRAEIPPCCR